MSRHRGEDHPVLEAAIMRHGFKADKPSICADCMRAGWDAYKAALPDMIKPLVWEGVESDCFLSCELETYGYEIYVSDTLERPCDYLWSVSYLPNGGRSVSLSYVGPLSGAIKAANAHNVATIMEVFE